MPRGWLLALLVPASALLSIPLLAPPSIAGSAPSQVAAIEATAPLDDESDGAVKHAIAAAVQTAARGAMAMGLPWLRIHAAYVREGYVGVQILATAQPPEDKDVEPETKPGDEPNMDEPRVDEPKGGKAPKFQL